ncbi:MAG TPA: DUF1440 domain-containing protein, partial [Gaiellales bacterium]|nr:DUF1440 domain-containing protein [Gaiellales bacterium]
LVDRISRHLGYGPLDTGTKLRIQNAIHYSFGAAFGAVYSLLTEAFPVATARAGTLAGVGLYAASHGSTLPLLRIQEPPWRLPRAAVAWELTSHLLFGAVLELGRRGARRLI